MNNRSKTARISRAYLLTRLSRHAFHPRGWNNRSSNPPSPSPNRYSINVIGRYNPRWSTRSAVNRGGVFCPRNWIRDTFPRRRERESRRSNCICVLPALRLPAVRVKWGNKNITRASNLSSYNGVHNSSPRCRVMIATPPQPVFLARPIRRKNRSGVLLEIIRVRSASSSSSPQFLTLVFFWWKFEREEGVDPSKFGRGILFSKGYLCGMGI